MSARIVTEDNGLTVEGSDGEFGTYGVAILADLVESIPCQQLPDGVTVARVEPGDDPLGERVTVEHDTIMEHVVDVQTNLDVYVDT